MFKRLLCLLLVSSACFAKDDARTPRPERVGSGTPRVCGIVAANPKGAISGTTVISYTIGPDGKVGDAKVAQSSGKPNLDLAATACVGTWKFKPATRKGKPVAFTDTLKIDWAQSNIALVPDTFDPATAITIVSKAPPPPSPPRIGSGMPGAVGRPHECSGFYPPEAIAAHAEGSAVLEFTVATDGSTKDVKIRSSSGNADLDAASLACVATWRYRPATRDGAPIEAPWQAKVMWAIPTDASPPPVPGRTSYTVPPTELDPSHDCSAYYPAGANGASGDVGVSFLVDARGALWDLKVTRSSGNADLDRAAVACAAFWKYKPALNGGTPVGLTWHASVHMARKG